MRHITKMLIYDVAFLTRVDLLMYITLPSNSRLLVGEEGDRYCAVGFVQCLN